MLILVDVSTCRRRVLSERVSLSVMHGLVGRETGWMGWAVADLSTVCRSQEQTPSSEESSEMQRSKRSNTSSVRVRGIV